MRTGVINLLKPPGMTSHDAVSFIRKTYGQKQVGHAGTLDPAAAGVLPIFLGRATRLVEYLADTGDDTGTITRRSEVIPSVETVDGVLQSFLGEGQQIPPMYSAIKVGGRKLYDLARQGITVERKPRAITIHAIHLISMEGSSALFDVICSKGTYIRTLCADAGVRCRSAAVMTFLLRTAVGNFLLANSFSLEEIAANPEQAVLPADYALAGIPAVALSLANTVKFLTGQKTPLDQPAQSIVKVYGADQTFIGIGSASGEQLIPEKVFPPDVVK